MIFEKRPESPLPEVSAMLKPQVEDRSRVTPVFGLASRFPNKHCGASTNFFKIDL
jgi:hypothetical protein